MKPTNGGRWTRPIQKISGLKWAQVAQVQCEGCCRWVGAYGRSQTFADRKLLAEVVEIIQAR